MKHTVKIIGYGSLVNKKSLKKSIKNHLNFKPVWVHGYKRVFDLKSVKHLYEPWEEDIAVLNVEKAPKSKFNGIVFEMKIDDFHKLIKREKTYELVKVKYSDYSTKKEMGDAFLFVGLEQDIDKHLNPRTHYFHICRNGSYDVSENFGKDWDKTTFLATGKKVSEIKRKLIDVKTYPKLKPPYTEKI